MANNHNFRYLRANMDATLCMAVGTIGDTLEYPHMIYCSCVPSFFFIKGQIHVLYDEKDGVVGFGIGIQFSGGVYNHWTAYHHSLQKQWVYTTVSQITQFIHLNFFLENSEFSLNYIIKDLWETDHHSWLSLHRIIKNCMPLFTAFN